MLNFDHFPILSRTLNRRKPSDLTEIGVKIGQKHRIVTFFKKYIK